VIAKREGVIVRWGLKEAWSKHASRWTRSGWEAYGVGRAGQWSRSPYPSRTLVVNPTVARVARLGFVTEGEAIHLDPATEVSSGSSTRGSEEGPNRMRKQ